MLNSPPLLSAFLRFVMFLQSIEIHFEIYLELVEEFSSWFNRWRHSCPPVNPEIAHLRRLHLIQNPPERSGIIIHACNNSHSQIVPLAKNPTMNKLSVPSPSLIITRHHLLYFLY